MKYKKYIDEKQIAEKINELGKKLDADYKDKNPLLVGILRGAYIFMADLSRKLNIQHNVDFMAVASYGASTTTSGVVRILKDLDTPIFQRHVIVVEDIVDSGLTLKYIKRLLNARSPASLSICALLNKVSAHSEKDLIDYSGFEIPNRFVMGYGLDYDQQYRNLPYIAYFVDKEVE